jgi:putative membrane protein
MVNARLHEFVDKKRVRDAILAAEATTTAPIAVTIAPHVEGDVHAAALRALRHRGLSRAPERNAVHFFVVPSRREFAVVGDAAAHERLGQAAWDGIAATVEKHFRRGDPTAGLVAGIEEAGRLLAEHFPRRESHPQP